jgi:hypothetical protein
MRRVLKCPERSAPAGYVAILSRDVRGAEKEMVETVLTMVAMLGLGTIVTMLITEFANSAKNDDYDEPPRDGYMRCPECSKTSKVGAFPWYSLWDTNCQRCNGTGWVMDELASLKYRLEQRYGEWKGYEIVENTLNVTMDLYSCHSLADAYWVLRKEFPEGDWRIYEGDHHLTVLGKGGTVFRIVEQLSV